MPFLPSTTLRHLTTGAACLAVLTGLVACGDEKPAAPAPAVEAAPPASPSPAQPERAPTSLDSSAKLNTYIACFNATQTRAHQAWERYTSWVKDIDAGPTGTEKVVYGVYTVSDDAVAQCGKPVLETAAGKPALPQLDTAAQAYSVTLTAWAKSLADADKYYAREDYKDDGMAQGKAMHADLAQHYKAYGQATTALSAALDVENDKRQLAQLQEVEKAQGRKFDYWHMSTMLTAKQLVTLVSEEHFDAEAAATKLKAYEAASSGLLAYSQTPDAQMPMMFSTMESAYETLLVAAKQRVRRVRDNTPYTTGETSMLRTAGWMVEGSSDRVVREYNALIEASNRLN